MFKFVDIFPKISTDMSCNGTVPVSGSNSLPRRPLYLLHRKILVNPLDDRVISVADPHHFDTYPGPAFHFDADPEPAFDLNADPDPVPTFTLIRILTFNLMQIRIRILSLTFPRFGPFSAPK